MLNSQRLQSHADERREYSDPEMCECGNTRNRRPNGKLLRACDRCMALEKLGMEAL